MTHHSIYFAIKWSGRGTSYRCVVYLHALTPPPIMNAHVSSLKALLPPVSLSHKLLRYHDVPRTMTIALFSPPPFYLQIYVRDREHHRFAAWSVGESRRWVNDCCVCGCHDGGTSRATAGLQGAEASHAAYKTPLKDPRVCLSKGCSPLILLELQLTFFLGRCSRKMWRIHPLFKSAYHIYPSTCCLL